MAQSSLVPLIVGGVIGVGAFIVADSGGLGPTVQQAAEKVRTTVLGMHQTAVTSGIILGITRSPTPVTTVCCPDCLNSTPPCAVSCRPFPNGCPNGWH